MGRVFTDDEARPGGPAVVLLDEQLWRTSFAADRGILGKTVVMDREPTVVIGIMPASFTGPSRSQFWSPLRLWPPQENGSSYYSVVARPRRDVSIDVVRAELAAIQRRLDPRLPQLARGFQPVVVTLHDRLYGNARRPLMLLFAAVGVLLLITCANLANLSLARATKRQREFALRLALGASGWRLVRYVLLESLLLSLGGAVLGVLLAASSIGYFVRISPSSVANVERIGIDETVLLFTLGVSAATSVLFGLVPALAAARSSRTSLTSASSHMTASRRRRLVQRSMVVVELATALVLVVGAGLVARTFRAVASIPAGYDPEHVLVADVDLPWDRYTDTTARRFMEQLLARVRLEPGVQSAAMADALPLGRMRRSVTVTTNGRSTLTYAVVAVTPGYFATLGTRIIEGRPIEQTDRADAATTAVVSATLARLLSSDRSAVGQRLGLGPEAPTIVGVAEDVRHWELEAVSPPLAFVQLSASDNWRSMALAVRSQGPTAPLIRAITRDIREIDSAQPPPRFRMMEDIVAEARAPRKFLFVLMGIFAGLAGTLAVIGLYGVLSYLVAERTKEIGIRAALGADAAKVIRLMLGQGMALAAIGIAAGLGVAAVAVRPLEKVMYGISVYDALTLASAVALLGLASFAATYLPARRASRVDPVIALRVD
jgi:predicted permease